MWKWPLERARPFWKWQMLLGKVSFGRMGEWGDEQSVPAQKIELVTADKFAGKLSFLLPKN